MKLRNLAFTIAAGAAVVTSCQQPTNQKAFDGKLNTEQDSVSYALGVQYGTWAKQQGFDKIDKAVFFGAIEGIMNEAENAPLDIDASNQFMQGYFAKLSTKKNEATKVAGEQFLAENAKKEGITTTESGLQYEVVKEGEGDKPGATDVVKVHYHGTLIDGTVFDSSVDRGEPIEFPLNGVIPGWTEGVQLMSVGSKYKFYIPYSLAYGERQAGPKIKPFSALVFEVELIEIKKAEEAK